MHVVSLFHQSASVMPSLTLKNIPEDLLESLREIAKRERRSLNSQLLYLLEQQLAAAKTATVYAYSPAQRTAALDEAAAFAATLPPLDDTPEGIDEDINEGRI